MGAYGLKPYFRERLVGAERLLIRLGVSADGATTAALGCALLAAALILWRNRWTLLLVPVLLFLRITLNALDGMIAQDRGTAWAGGELFNELSDRLADIAILVAAALWPGVPPLLGFGMVIAVLLSSYVGILAKAAGAARQYGGIMGKADRMLCVGLAAVVAAVDSARATQVWEALALIVLAGALITLVQRLRRSYAALPPRR